MSWQGVAGLLLGLLGFGVTIVAQLHMGDSWRVGVAEREKTSLVTAGLFSMVRNPIFTGMLLLTAGLFCMAPNVMSLAAFVTSLLGVEIQVRRVEEPYLIRIHGEPYLSYARAVGRFLPWVGRLA
jgi:protein-S-isoprenylcysteine O-methyltransferase Ste14